MEYVTITIPRSDYDNCMGKGLFTDCMVKEVVIKDDFFQGDALHKAMKDESTKAYKRLKEYEFFKRNP